MTATTTTRSRDATYTRRVGSAYGGVEGLGAGEDAACVLGWLAAAVFFS